MWPREERRVSAWLHKICAADCRMRRRLLAGASPVRLFHSGVDKMMSLHIKMFRVIKIENARNLAGRTLTREHRMPLFRELSHYQFKCKIRFIWTWMICTVCIHLCAFYIPRSALDGQIFLYLPIDYVCIMSKRQREPTISSSFVVPRGERERKWGEFRSRLFSQNMCNCAVFGMFPLVRLFTVWAGCISSLFLFFSIYNEHLNWQIKSVGRALFHLFFRRGALVSSSTVDGRFNGCILRWKRRPAAIPTSDSSE